MKQRNEFLLTSPKSPTLSKELLGSLNPNVLSLPLLQNSQKKNVYSNLTDLTVEAEELQKENDELKKQLNDLIKENDTNPFYQYKKLEIDFRNRLLKRDKELSEFSKFLTTYRTSTDNTFVEINAKKKTKAVQFDSIAYTLLVSNKQVPFFSTEDLSKQNEDLRVLIGNQNETLHMLQSRLNTYSQYYNESSAKGTVEALKNGFIPSKIQGAVPSRTVELRNKRALMSETLKKLVEKRKKVLEPKKKKRDKKREERKQNQKAVIIQKVMRGYLVRKHRKEMNDAAIKIQSLWRGYVVRIKKKKAAPQKEALFKVKKRKLANVVTELIKMNSSRVESNEAITNTARSDDEQQSGRISSSSSRSSSRLSSAGSSRKVNSSGSRNSIGKLSGRDSVGDQPQKKVRSSISSGKIEIKTKTTHRPVPASNSTMNINQIQTKI